MLKSRISWLNLVDKNTKFFHKAALTKRRKNKITHLLIGENNWVNDFQEIGHEIISALINTFCSTTTITSPDENTLNLLPKLTMDQNLNLVTTIVISEIKTTLWNIHPFKTPGDDGLHVAFYQKIGIWFMKKFFSNSKQSSPPGVFLALGLKHLYVSFVRQKTPILSITTDH